MHTRLLSEIFSRMTAEGFVPGTEQYEICRRGVQYFGFTYDRSEELARRRTIDCSTLVSQSYWEGAAIGIPFVAENQRTAVTGQIVSSLGEINPADVLIKYPSVTASPDKKWNHVGLYLGRDNRGEQWLIESTSAQGVRLSRVCEFDAQGGIRRYTLSRELLNSPRAHAALELTQLVPKFGRLGVRQYRKSQTERCYHRGLDFYVAEGTEVYSTMSGRVVLANDPIERSQGVQIVGDSMSVRYLMVNRLNVTTGEIVRVGDLIGCVALPSESSDIIYSSASVQLSHLHLEVEAHAGSEEENRNQVTIENKQYLNHLYLSKLGVLAVPFR